MTNVLVVDDSLFSRRSLKTIINQAGFTVVAEASNGIEAFEKYKEFKPDLVTMDITMPLQNGIEAVKNIISINPEAKIIMVSAINQKNLIFEAIQSGACHYIIKPFDYEKISTIFEKVLAAEKNNRKEPSIIGKSDNNLLGAEAEKDISPFYLENRNNFIIINFTNELNIKNFCYLNESVKTLLIIKPLKIIFNFNDIELLDNSVLEQILVILDKIQKADGKVVFFSKNNEFLKILVDKKFPVLMSYYVDYLDVSNIEV